MSNDRPKQPVRLSRDELHERVWQATMTRLAGEFGISDTGLKKICRRLDVPCPPAGWWNKKAAGHKVKVVPLPPAKPGTPLQVTISPTPSQADGGLRNAVNELASSLGEIRVPERLVRPHAVIAAWIEDHRQRQAFAREHRRTSPYSTYAVPDLTEAERRRHRVLQALFRALEQHGATISQDDRQHLFAKVSGERIEFSCHEKSRQVTRPLTAEEKRWRISNTNGMTKELEPTGRLEFQVRTWIDQPIRKLWLETDRQPLEAMLPEIVATFLVLGDERAQQARRREEDARLWRERQRQLELEQQRRQQDDNRWKRFVEIADDWRRAEVAREAIARLRQLVPDLNPIDGRSQAEWLDWAEAKASECDLVSQGVGYVFADVAKVGPFVDHC